MRFFIKLWLICCLSSFSFAELNWGDWTPHPAYPELHTRVAFYNFNPYGDAPYQQMWMVGFKNTSSSELEFNFDMTDVGESRESLRYRTSPAILPGEVRELFITFFLKAQPNEPVLVWLSDISVNGEYLDVRVPMSSKLGEASLYENTYVGDSSSSTDSEPLCQQSPSFSSTLIQQELNINTEINTTLFNVFAQDLTGGSCPISYRLQGSFDQLYYFNLVGQQLQLALALPNKVGNVFKFSVIADNGTSTARQYVELTLITDPYVYIESGQSFSLRSTSTYGYYIGSVMGGFYGGDDSNLQYSIIAGNDHNWFTLYDNGTLLLTVNNLNELISANQTEALTIRVTDGANLSAQANIDIHILANNEPVILSQQFTMAQLVSANAIVGKINAIDGDNDALTFSLLANDPQSLSPNLPISVDAQFGWVRVLEPEFFAFPEFGPAARSYQFDVEVSDGSNSQSKTLTLTVNGNQTPELASNTYNIDSLSSNELLLVGHLKAIDGDYNPLFYEILSGNDEGVFSINANGSIWANLSLASQANYNLLVEVSDRMNSVTAMQTIQLQAAPKLIEEAKYINAYAIQGGFEVMTVQAEDLDSDTLTFKLLEGGSYFSLSADAKLSFWPAYNWLEHATAPAKFYPVVEVSDGALTSQGQLAIHVVQPMVDFDYRLQPGSSGHDFSIYQCGYPVWVFLPEMYDSSLAIGAGPYQYELVNGEGDRDNELFRVLPHNGTIVSLGTNISEYTEYHLRLAVTDSLGNRIEKAIVKTTLDFDFMSPVWRSLEICQRFNTAQIRYKGPTPLLPDQDRSDHLSATFGHYYSIDITEQQTVHISIESDIDLQMHLVDESGDIVASQFDDIGNLPYFSGSLAAGNYQLVLLAEQSDLEGEYRILMTADEPSVSVTPTADITSTSASKPSGGAWFAGLLMLMLLIPRAKKVLN